MTYDRQGLGLAELTRLALTHSFIFAIVYWMTQHNMSKLALKITRGGYMNMNNVLELLNFKLEAMNNYDECNYEELSWEEYQTFLTRLDQEIEALKTK